jgi:phosphotransferase system  glucose/maltose/N-acetylglucosamine-specific IIC component
MYSKIKEMRYIMYYSRNGGCLFLIIGAFIFMFFLSAITSLLFTPVGMGIALILGGYYLFRKNRLDNNSEDEVEVEINIKNEASTNEETSPLEDDEFSREAEDVDYKIIE